MSLGAKPKAVFLGAASGWSVGRHTTVYPEAVRRKLEEIVEMYPVSMSIEDIGKPEHAEAIANARFVFSTWGMPKLEGEKLAKFEKLEAVFYAAGSVQGFAAPFLEKGVRVFSAWGANAVPVAEFTVAQVILSLKGTWRLALEIKNKGQAGWQRQIGPGAYGSTVALISLGMIGRRVAEMLRDYEVKVIAYEPYGKPEVAKELGVELVSLEECFARGDVVSLHAPNLPATKKMIKPEHFRRMKPGATFINTARAQIVDNEGMFEVLKDRPDVMALLDVADPTEPPPAGSGYYTLPNVILTPHIAGSGGLEHGRMGMWMVEECKRLLRGEKAQWEVSKGMLATMA